jgi:hypothetical protein
MNLGNGDEDIRADQKPARHPVLHDVTRRRILQLLAAFVAIDGVILLICPMYGGDCLYGFFTLIAFPVMLSGPAGVLLPRFALRHFANWRSRGLIWVGGGLMLLTLATICHAATIRFFNYPDYGDVLIRNRLLVIELALIIIYYTGLSIIAFVKSPPVTDQN